MNLVATLSMRAAVTALVVEAPLDVVGDSGHGVVLLLRFKPDDGAVQEVLRQTAQWEEVTGINTRPRL